MQVALQQTQQRVTQARERLPAGVHIEVERLSPSVFPIFSYNLEGGDPATLYDLAQYEIRPVVLARARRGPRGRAGIGGARGRGDRGSRAAGRARDELQRRRAGDRPRAHGGCRRSRDASLLAVPGGRRPGDSPADNVGDIVIGNGLRVRDIATCRSGTDGSRERDRRRRAARGADQHHPADRRQHRRDRGQRGEDCREHCRRRCRPEYSWCRCTIRRRSCATRSPRCATRC